jgi:NTE family protein
MHTKKKKRIGLALGSGSARGWAHIGVIEALLESDYDIQYISGTSIGALVGAVFASGRLDALKQIVLQIDWRQILGFLDLTLPRSGLIDGKKVTNFIRNYVHGEDIKGLPVKFSAVSTKLNNGQEVVISEGDVIEAVRASISVPGIFTPVIRDDAVLVDGGLVNPVPVNVVRDMGADFVIAVNLNQDIIEKKSLTNIKGSSQIQRKYEDNIKNRALKALNEKFEKIELPLLKQVRKWISEDKDPNIFDVLLSAINIMEVQITNSRLKINPPDLLIEPPLWHIRFLEFNRAEEAIEAGYRETMKRLKTIPCP